MIPLYLASKSPRRKELLEKAGIPFSVFSIEVSEIPDKNITPEEQILDIATRKGLAAAEALRTKVQGPALILSSDTEVVFEARLLGKPESDEEAFQTLSALSGQSHEVITAVVLLDLGSGKQESHIEKSIVTFRQLKDQEIHDYLKTGEHKDKAGSYGIQGFGRGLVESFTGDIENIIGLPTKKVQVLLQKMMARDYTDNHGSS